MSINNHSRLEGERSLSPIEQAARRESPRSLGAQEFTPEQRKFWQSLFSHYDATKSPAPAARPVAHREIQHAAPAETLRPAAPVEARKPAHQAAPVKHAETGWHGIPAGTGKSDLSGWNMFFGGNNGRVEPGRGGRTEPVRPQAERNDRAPALPHAESHPGHGSIGGTMSWYGEPQGMANGHRFNKYAYTVAHKSLPLGTVLDIHAHGKTIRAEVTDRGPYHGNRSLDVSYAIARDFGFLNKGVTDYSATIVSTPNYYHSHHHRSRA